MSRFSEQDNTDAVTWTAIGALLLFGLALLYAGEARAQVADQNTPRQYQFTFSAQEVNIIEAGLNELPRKMAEPVIQNMQNQVRMSVAARAKSDEDAKAKAEKEKADALAKMRAEIDREVRAEFEAKKPDPNGNDATPLPQPKP